MKKAKKTKTKVSKKSKAKKTGKKIDLSRVKECPECASSNIIYNERKDEIICQDCGAIFSELPPDLEKRFEKVSDVI